MKGLLKSSEQVRACVRVIAYSRNKTGLGNSARAPISNLIPSSSRPARFPLGEVLATTYRPPESLEFASPYLLITFIIPTHIHRSTGPLIRSAAIPKIQKHPFLYTRPPSSCRILPLPPLPSLSVPSPYHRPNFPFPPGAPTLPFPRPNTLSLLISVPFLLRIQNQSIGCHYSPDCRAEVRQ